MSIEVRDYSEDAVLVGQSLKGKKEAFDQLVKRHWDLALALALALSKVGTLALAEDIAQNSFLKAYRHLGRLRQPDRFAGWLCRIVKQEAVNVIRHQARHQRYLESEAVLPARLTHNPGLNESQRDFVRRTMIGLPEKFRIIVVLRFVSGLSAPQIARQLNKSPGSVRMALHRAYQHLHEQLMPLFEEVDQ